MHRHTVAFYPRSLARVMGFLASIVYWGIAGMNSGLADAPPAKNNSKAPAPATATALKNALSPATPKAIAGSTPAGPAAGFNTVSTTDNNANSDQQFHQKLTESMQKTEKSIKILRQQVSESQQAPFLPDLYLQLADLLSQKSVTLYYIQMEKEKDSPSGDTSSSKVATPVVAAQKEAVEVYKTIMHDFPTFAKRSETLFKLSLSYQAIDDSPDFIRTVGMLIAEFPKSEEAMKANLLLAQHFFDQGEFDEAYKIFAEIAKSTYPYERNLAQYRIGLIYLAREKYPESLHQFEIVVNDPELKEQENPYEIHKKAEATKRDLKKEALVDSIRAYTFVFAKNPDPVAYYSKLCPTELYFQDIIEKLALRYIFLKKYETAIQLLRVLSERSADPQRILNIYQQVLVMIPIQDRIRLPIEEMRFVLQKYNLWWAYYNVQPAELTRSYWFLEQQTRELGTNSHAIAKNELRPDLKTYYLERARDYYLLYITFFDHTPNTVKIATDLADTYFLLKDYLNSGDYYLRTFQGKFGAPNASEKKALIENAILCLQKEATGDFYERVRIKGLLIKSVQTYMAFNPALRNDPKTELLLIKARYEQAFFPETISELYNFMKKHHNTSQARDAGDLILDYYNTLNDFNGLKLWADRLLSLHLPDSSYNAKLASIKTQSNTKMVQEKIKSISGYDEFSQGRSYLTAALASSSDASLKNLALQEALSASKRDHDIQTFMAAATLMAGKEKDSQKKSEILRSIAQENMKIGRYYAALTTLRTLVNDNTLDPRSRTNALEDWLDAGMQLRDRHVLEQGLSHPLAAQISVGIKTKVRDQISDMLDSPIEVSPRLLGILFRLGVTDETLLSLYRAQYKIDGSTRARTRSMIQSRCGADSKQTPCRWLAFESLEGRKLQIINYLGHASTNVQAIETSATPFMALISQLQALDGSDDPHLEVAVSLANKELYAAFAAYLNRTAQANPALRNDLVAKAQESVGNASREQQKCDLIKQKSSLINPALKFCDSPQTISFKELLVWHTSLNDSAPESDPTSQTIADLEKSIFTAQVDPNNLLKLVTELYNMHYYHHVNALSSYGMSVFHANEGDFKAFLGCSVLRLGLYNEASYHLQSASDYLNIKSSCTAELNQIRGLR